MKKPVKVAKKLGSETKLDKIAEASMQEKYSNQYYPEGSVVEVSGADFADFVTVIQNNQQMLGSIKEALDQMSRAVDARMASNDVLTLTLMKYHTSNVDKGITLTHVEPAEETEGASEDSYEAPTTQSAVEELPNAAAKKQNAKK